MVVGPCVMIDDDVLHVPETSGAEFGARRVSRVCVCTRSRDRAANVCVRSLLLALPTPSPQEPRRTPRTSIPLAQEQEHTVRLRVSSAPLPVGRAAPPAAVTQAQRCTRPRVAWGASPGWVGLWHKQGVRTSGATRC